VKSLLVSSDSSNGADSFRSLDVSPSKDEEVVGDDCGAGNHLHAVLVHEQFEQDGRPTAKRPAPEGGPDAPEDAHS